MKDVFNIICVLLKRVEAIQWKHIETLLNKKRDGNPISFLTKIINNQI